MNSYIKSILSVIQSVCLLVVAFPSFADLTNAQLQAEIVTLQNDVVSLQGTDTWQTNKITSLSGTIEAQNTTITNLKNTLITDSNQIVTLTNTTKTQATEIADLQPSGLTPMNKAVLNHLDLESAPGTANIASTDLYMTGVNLHVVDGNSFHRTDDNQAVNPSVVLSGLGNLIIGYNTPGPNGPDSGSHNLILGDLNSYTSYGGFIGGNSNAILGPYNSILTGFEGYASGSESAIICGEYNEVYPNTYNSVVLGGYGNGAYQSQEGTIVGGNSNEVGGQDCSMLGGFGNTNNISYSTHLGGSSSSVPAGTAIWPTSNLF